MESVPPCQSTSAWQDWAAGCPNWPILVHVPWYWGGTSVALSCLSRSWGTPRGGAGDPQQVACMSLAPWWAVQLLALGRNGAIAIVPLALSLQAHFKSLSPSFLKAPFRHWKAAIRSLKSLLFSRLNIHKNA